ncbi:MAG: hypothetical protein ACSHX6_11050 [Akkermansiaceae bacterium]
MELLGVYDDQDEAEEAKGRISGAHRLASDRDDNQVVWRLFGTPSWGNFYALGMYELPKLKELVDLRKAGGEYDREEHERIISNLGSVVNTYGLRIPEHWV